MNNEKTSRNFYYKRYKKKLGFENSIKSEWLLRERKSNRIKRESVEQALLTEEYLGEPLDYNGYITTNSNHLQDIKANIKKMLDKSKRLVRKCLKTSPNIKVSSRKKCDIITIRREFIMFGKAVPTRVPITILTLLILFTTPFITAVMPSNILYVYSEPEVIVETIILTEYVEVEVIVREYVYIEPPPEPRPTRDDYIWEIYRHGTFVYVSPEHQWLIRDLAEKHGYCERLIIGLILRESTFRTNSHNLDGNWQGWTQIHPSWNRNRHVAPYRLTDDHASRSLFDPYQHMQTLMEIWNFARSRFNIDTSTEQGMREVLWWHMSGRYIRGVDHHEIRRVFRFADEIVEICYEEAPSVSHLR
jgi:hypothetical protein